MNKNILAMILGIIAIAIAFVVFPIVMDASHTILSNAHIADYTGLSSIVGVAPLIVFVGLLFTGGFSMYKGISGMRKSRGD